MHKSAVLLAVPFLLLAGCQSDLVTATPSSAAPSFAVQGGGPAASGRVVRTGGVFGAIIDEYSFNAHTAGTGSVVGRWAEKVRYPDGTMDSSEGDLLCVVVDPDGITARMTGIITNASYAPFIGFYAMWTVRDNGEGAKASPDRATELLFVPQRYADWHCAVGFPPSSPIWSGTFGESRQANVQVRP